MKKYFAIVCTLIIWVGCKPQAKTVQLELSKKDDNVKKSGLLLGGDRDEQGCIGTTGYTWSVLYNDCIRQWRIGIELVNASGSKKTTQGYVVFNHDNTKAELFLSNVDTNYIIIKTNDNWVGFDYTLNKTDKGFKLLYQGKVVYLSK